MGLLECTATLLGSTKVCTTFTTLPHCWRLVGGGTPSLHYATARADREARLLRCRLASANV